MKPTTKQIGSRTKKVLDTSEKDGRNPDSGELAEAFEMFIKCFGSGADDPIGEDDQMGARTRKVRGIARATQELRDAILSAFTGTSKPVTVRQMFYMLSVRGAVEKEEAGYRKAQRQLLQMRREGVIPYGWIADGTRWMRKPDTYSSLESALRQTAQAYRRAVWEGLDVYVEVWCEKDALAGVLYPVTSMYDIPLMIARGYSSESFAHEAAMQIAESGKKGVIYYVGDFDPSGWQMAENLEAKIKGFGADIDFTRLAITPEMTDDWWNLPTRPTKTTDTRCRAFFDRFGKDTPSIELDALPPDVLRKTVLYAIEEHIPEGHLDRLRVAEESERGILGDLIARVGARPE